ncbi:CPBP family intramembrane glutamic endopeptidase [Aquiflexum lacus]|uniref:CPBP family intramembrane glutamic endopeptidase n=1 Tax=Aquiflexum lacus TaxID=2483805 RepID=UPI0018940FE1|nr:CPBP family intramembrane glutamic endopeptidase [Aquiflexum lacus]
MNWINSEFLYHTFAYLAMFAVSWYAYYKKSLKFFSDQGWAKHMGPHFLVMGTGILVWGLLPLIIWGSEFSEDIILGKNPLGNMQWLLVASLVILASIVGFSQSKKLQKIDTLFIAPPIPLIVALFFIFRISFLIAYEFWFRGIFLQDLLSSFSTSLAIGINVFLYALIHYFAGPKEAWSSIAFGVILCLLVIFTLAVWPAIIIHLSLSLSFESGFFQKAYKRLYF